MTAPTSVREILTRLLSGLHPQNETEFFATFGREGNYQLPRIESGNALYPSGGFSREIHRKLQQRW
jgi:hypothetical protein